MKMTHEAMRAHVDMRLESLKIAFGILILFAGSQIALPLKPVPITMQTVAVMLIGLLYTPRSALLSVLLYTTLGGMGVPVFQGFASGFSHPCGPTAGYILGFTVAVYGMTFLREKFGLTSFWGILANCIVGTVIIFICGVSWLASIVGIREAIALGMLPFIIPGAVKAIALSGALRFIRGDKPIHG